MRKLFLAMAMAIVTATVVSAQGYSREIVMAVSPVQTDEDNGNEGSSEFRCGIKFSIGLSGMTKTEWDKTALRKESPYRATVIALDYRNRDILYERIDNRVEKMLSDGLETEVRTLLSENALKPNTTAACAIGYKELIAYFNGDISLEQATENMKSATRHYAKRQLTWFRRNPDIRWLYPGYRPPYSWRCRRYPVQLP